ncbi:MAG: AAA family ATPase [Streptosporangiaceae bacterium]
MNIGLEINSSVLREQTLQPYLKAGFTKDWLHAKRDSSDIFHDDHYRVYDYLLTYWADHNKVPDREMFQHEFPEKSYHLSDRDLTPAELIDRAARDVRRLILAGGINEAVDLYKEDQKDRDADVVRRLEETVQEFHKYGGPASVADDDIMPALKFSELDNAPIRWRIEGLWPESCHVLNAGYAKTGKTTTTLEIIKVLAHGGTLLDKDVQKIYGRIGYVNLELSEQMLRQYAKERGIDLNDDKIRVFNYQGRASKFKVSDPAWRERFSEVLKENDIEVLIIDPISPILACQGIKANDPSEVRRVLEDFSALVKPTDTDLLINQHTGHEDKSRARDASSQMDWADVLWNIQKVGGEDSPSRKLSVEGRGVMHSTITYTMDPETGDLVPDEVSVVRGRAKKSIAPADVLDEHQGRTVKELEVLMTLSNSAVQKTVKTWESQGHARSVTGAGSKGATWYLVGDC